MIVIFGGAYQGKRDFAQERFNLEDKDIWVCDDGTELDFSKKAFTHLERFILSRIENNLPVFEYFEKNGENLRDKILLCDDICCGVVPIEKKLRLWRDNVGKQMQIFCRQADEVYRVYCGIGQRIK